MIEGISIDRPELFKTLKSEALRGHVLVLGEPGVGKTFLLEFMAQDFINSDNEIYYIEADRFEVSSITELYSALGLPGTLHEALLELEPKRNAFFFVDGLDAARNEKTQTVFRELIRNVMTKAANWTVIAGIRTYDALKSREIWALFGAKNLHSAKFTDPLIQEHHILIPPLDRAELQQVGAQSLEIRTLLEKGRPEFTRLLTIPRNIEFAVMLVNSGVSLHELSEVQSEIQLLNVFWGHYVLSDPYVEQKRMILKQVTRRMFERRNLIVNMTEFFGQEFYGALQELLHHSIVKPLTPGSDFVKFANHTLFDYAVSRHLIPEDSTKGLLEFVDQRENQVFFNPSIRYFLAFQWFYRKEFFWEIVGTMSGNDHLSPSVKVMPFVTITDEASELNDIDGLIKLLVSEYGKSRILYYFLISLSKHIKGSVQSPVWWVHVLKVLLPFVDEHVWWLYVEVLSWFGDNERIPRLREKMQDLSAIGTCARELLRRGWEMHKPALENVNAKRVVGLVCLTYNSDEKASREVLLQVLKRVGDPNVSVDEVYRLSEGVKEVIQYDPEFVVEVYSTVFGYEEKSDEKTAMGGVVLSLTSTRKQDYQMSQYHLQKAFDYFLSVKPVFAARALIRSVEGFIENRERRPEENIPVILENGINYCVDFSYIWDSNRSHEYEDARIMMTQFEDWLSDSNDQANAQQVFEEIVRINRQAAIWRRVLYAVSRNPSTLLNLGHRLLTTKALLIGRDTHYVASEALRAVVPHLDKNQRRQVEEAITTLPDYDATWEFREERMREALAGMQTELLAVIPADLIITPELKRMREKLMAEKKLSKPRPPFEMSEVEMMPHIEKEWLKEQGVQVEKKENARLIEISDAMRVINTIFEDKATKFEAIQATWERVAKLWLEYNELTSEGDERARETAMTQFGEYASNVARYRAFELSSPYGVFIWEIVECLMADPEPRYDPKYHSSLTTPSWSPAPRIEGVESLMHLLLANKVQMDRVRNLVIDFSKDEIPIIRFFIARNLPWIHQLDEPLFWSIAETILTTETKATAATLTTLLHSLHALMGNEHVRATTANLVSRCLELLGSDEPDREGYRISFEILTELYVLYNGSNAKRILDGTLSAGLNASEAASHMLRSALAFTVFGISAGAWKQADADAIRERSLAFTMMILDYMSHQLDFIQRNRSTVAQDSVRKFYRLINAFGDYFALDVDWGQEHKRKEVVPLQIDERRRYFSEVARPVLSRLIEVCDPVKESGIPPDTAHNLLELAQSLVQIDFKEVLKIVSGIVHASRPGGYHLDSFAMGDLEKFVDICLSDHRPTLRDDPESLRLLTDILDVFVEVGWSEALGLVLRLDQIFM